MRGLSAAMDFWDAPDLGFKSPTGVGVAIGRHHDQAVDAAAQAQVLEVGVVRVGDGGTGGCGTAAGACEAAGAAWRCDAPTAASRITTAVRTTSEGFMNPPSRGKGDADYLCATLRRSE